MRFSGSGRTSQNAFFRVQTAIQVPTPPNLGVLSSIISLILINQALGHPKMRFSGSRPTEFPFIHPPPKRCNMGFFTS